MLLNNAMQCVIAQPVLWYPGANVNQSALSETERKRLLLFLLKTESLGLESWSSD